MCRRAVVLQNNIGAFARGRSPSALTSTPAAAVSIGYCYLSWPIHIWCVEDKLLRRSQAHGFSRRYLLTCFTQTKGKTELRTQEKRSRNSSSTLVEQKAVLEVRRTWHVAYHHTCLCQSNVSLLLFSSSRAATAGVSAALDCSVLQLRPDVLGSDWNPCPTPRTPSSNTYRHFMVSARGTKAVRRHSVRG